MINERRSFLIDLLYRDRDGGQRTVSRFVYRPVPDGRWLTGAVRHWNLDRPSPR